VTKITELHRISINNARALLTITNTYKRALTETSYTKGVQFYEKKDAAKMKKLKLFVTKNTHKGIFGILENCWVYQQKCWVPQAVLYIQVCLAQNGM